MGEIRRLRILVGRISFIEGFEGFYYKQPKIYLKKIVSKTLRPWVFGRRKQRNPFRLVKFELDISVRHHFLLLTIIKRYFTPISYKIRTRYFHSHPFSIIGNCQEVFCPNFLLMAIIRRYFSPIACKLLSNSRAYILLHDIGPLDA